MTKEEENVKKALDELLHSVQMKAYFMGYNTGYAAGCRENATKENPKRSIPTEEEEAGAARMGKTGFSTEKIRYRIPYIRKNEIEKAIRSILEGGEEGKTRLGGKTG